MDFYTLADLERVTGAKRRSLQLWADAGVIQAEQGTNRAGTGRHRLFSREQAIVACIIRGFAERQMAIGELLAIAEKIRELFRSNVRVLPNVESVIKGEKDQMLILETWIEGRVAPVLRLPESFGVVAELSDAFRNRMQNLRPGYDVMIAEITRATNEHGEEAIVMPVLHFEKPEAIAVALRLRTYLSNMDVE